MGELFIRTPLNPSYASTLFKRVYRCTPVFLVLQNQILSVKELNLFVSGDELLGVTFTDSTVKNDVDGSVENFESYFEVFLKSHFVNITLPSEQHGVGENTSRKMVEMLENKKSSIHINLQNIPENFQFAAFACFLKANLTGNQYIKHGVQLSFSDTISPEFQNQLQAFVHEIIALVEQDRFLKGHGVPIIKFVGHDEEAYLKLNGLRKVPQYARKTVRGEAPPQ